MKGILGCLLVAFAVTVPSCLGSLIVGGKESVPNSRPYQVAIMNSNNFQFCGGTLVHKNWVVSAAHCAGSGAVYAALGYHNKKDHNQPDQQKIQGSWIKHPSFSSQSLNNDIALIKLSTPATINTKVQTIGISSSPPSEGTALLVSGWGRLYESGTPSKELREVVVDAMSTYTCKSAYGGITNNMFCAGVSGGGKDSCQGDSGGPIVSNYGDGFHDPSTELEGIVSWGYGCAQAKYPGVYTKVSNYCSWLSQTTGGEVNC